MRKLLVVGLGLIGGSLAMALRGFEDYEVVGTDCVPAVREKAAAMGAGDRIALAICGKNGAELGELVLAAARRLGMERGEVALLGGLLTRSVRLRESLTAYLEARAPGLWCVEPRQDAAAGAAMLALELAGA